MPGANQHWYLRQDRHAEASDTGSAGRRPPFPHDKLAGEFGDDHRRRGLAIPRAGQQELDVEVGPLRTAMERQLTEIRCGGGGCSEELLRQQEAPPSRRKEQTPSYASDDAASTLCRESAGWTLASGIATTAPSIARCAAVGPAPTGVTEGAQCNRLASTTAAEANLQAGGREAPGSLTSKDFAVAPAAAVAPQCVFFEVVDDFIPVEFLLVD
mmetsp:Transcript_60000/g.167406  ORF Transcript_60000/g.167406 Transcript_60000/m.167406 type:complete len:213 (+) Transcript_60000:2098-2736(+)